MSVFKNFDRRLVLILSAGFALISVLPFFLYEFGVNNDYFLLWPRDAFWLRYEESHSLMVLGRPLGALLVSAQTFFYQNIAHFSLGRLISTVCLFAVIWHLAAILRRQTSLDAWWVFLMTSMAFFLPFCQTAMMWNVHFAPGILNLALVVWVSGCLLSAPEIRQSPGVFIRSRMFWLSWCGVLAAFMIYPITALFPTVILSAIILFRDEAEQDLIRSVLRNFLILIISAMGVYFILDRCVVYPVYRALAEFPQQADQLRAIAGVAFEPVKKWHLLQGMLSTALAGHYHMLIGDRSIPTVLTAFFLTALGCGCAAFSRGRVNVRSIKIWAERLLWMMGLMILSIVPILVSKTYNVINYRTLLCPSMMFLLIWVWMVWRMGESLRDERAKAGVAAVVALIAVAQMVTTHLHARAVAENHARELRYIRKQIQTDLSAVDRFLFLGSPPQDHMSLTGRPFFYEFGYMIQGDMIKPVISEQITQRKLTKSFDITYVPQLFEGRQMVIDMNAAMKPVR